MSVPPNGAHIFNDIAERYDTYRPGYPRELIDDIVALSHLPPDGRILEIGCGPGKATLPFAARGYTMLCLDPGAELIARARKKVRAYPKVQFLVTTFEDWPLEEAAFDLVIAASSFHWVKPEVGFPKVAAALKASGAFAIFRNARGLGDAALQAAIEQAYAAYAPEEEQGWSPWQRPHHLHDPRQEEIEATGLFREVVSRFHPWSQHFTAEEYLGLLGTYSGHHTMPDAARTALYTAITEAITQHGGIITVNYVSTLYLAIK